MKKLFFLFAAVLAVSSCGEDPVPAPEPSGDATFPLGVTASHTAADLFGDMVLGELDMAADGTYYLALAGPKAELKADPLYGFSGERMFARYVGVPFTTEFALFEKPAVGDADAVDLSGQLPALLNGGGLTQRATVIFDGFPETLTSLRRIYLTDDSTFDVEVSVVDPYFTAGTVKAAVAMDLSSIFGFRDAAGGVLAFEAALTPENGYCAMRAFHPETAAVSGGQYNPATRRLQADVEAVVKVGASHDGLRTTREKMAAAAACCMLRVSITLRKIVVDGIDGEFDVAFKPAESRVSLSTLTATSAADGKSLDVLGLDRAATRISVIAENKFPMPFTATTDIAARMDSRDVADVRGIGLTMEPPSLEEAGRTRFDFPSGEIRDVLVSGTHELAFIFNAGVDGISGTYRAGQVPAVAFVPSVIVPMCFGDALDVTGEDTVLLPAGMRSSLENGQLEVAGMVSNFFPATLSITVTAVNEKGEMLAETVPITVPAETETDVRMTFRPLSADPLTAAAAFVVSYRLRGVDNSRGIRASDYIRAALEARISYPD
jgi:hypothetical protein